jgi:glutathione S-transferase
MNTGSCWSCAACVVAAVIRRAIDMDLAAAPHLANWLNRCLDRPAARAAYRLRAEPDAGTPPDVTRMIARVNRL